MNVEENKIFKKVQEKAKEQAKSKRSRNSEIGLLLSNKEVVKSARYLAKKMPRTKALEVLNSVLEEEGLLPVSEKTGKVKKISYQSFLKMLPRTRKKQGENSEGKEEAAEDSEKQEDQ